jgi:hypothetical protein
VTRVYGWKPDEPATNEPPRSYAGRWHVTLPTSEGDVTITAPNAVSTEAMREAMRAYWGEKT